MENASSWPHPWMTGRYKVIILPREVFAKGVICESESTGEAALHACPAFCVFLKAMAFDDGQRQETSIN